VTDLELYKEKCSVTELNLSFAEKTFM